VTDGERPRERSPEPDEAPADEEYARAYAAGYEEGIRSALREVLAHASRGRTNQELRALVQSRLARLSEEVDLKRRSVLGPPRPRPFGELARTPLSFAAAPALLSGGTRPPPVGAGETVLVREARPERAIDLLLASRERFPRTILVSPRPPELGRGAGEIIVVPVARSSSPSGTYLAPGQVAGRLRELLEQPGATLVYVDALESFVLTDGAEIMLRFVGWLVEEVGRHGSALIVSYDPRSLVGTDIGRLERLFSQVVDGSAAPPRSSA
jgi:hypothetical protein